MTISDLGRYAFGIGAAIAVLAGCGSQAPIGAPGAMAPMQANRQSALGTAAEVPATNSHLYVANRGKSTVTVYARSKRNTKVLRTISQGIDVPQALAFGSSRYLYVANIYGNTVTEYARARRRCFRRSPRASLVRLRWR
jgi:hypothetical protein